MVKSKVATTLGIAVLLASCGGRPDDPPPRPEPHVLSTQSRAGIPTAIADGQRTPAPPVSDSEMTQLKHEVAQLRHEVAELRQQIGRRSTDAVIRAEAAADPRTDPEARAEADRTERLRIASSESSFRREPNDPRGSLGTAAVVRAALAESDESLRNQVRSIECRMQSCRVEISGDSAELLARDLPMVISRLGQTLPNVTAGQIDQGDGRQATVLYLSR